VQRKFNFSTGEFYHLYNRGTEKRDIFLDDSDYLRFQTLLYLSNNTEAVHLSNLFSRQNHPHREQLMRVVDKIKREGTLVDIGAYCLMPNHFHILVHEKIDNGVSTFMKKLATGYSMYFNKKNERSGALFEGRFKAVHASRDEYLKYLFSYIHLNPVKLIDLKWKEKGIADILKAKEYLKQYSYSSYNDYQGKVRPENIILNQASFPDYFSSDGEFETTINDWILFNPNNSLEREDIKDGP